MNHIIGLPMVNQNRRQLTKEATPCVSTAKGCDRTMIKGRQSSTISDENFMWPNVIYYCWYTTVHLIIVESLHVFTGNRRFIQCRVANGTTKKKRRISEVSGKYLVRKVGNVLGVLWEENEYENISITDETTNISIWIK